MSMFGIFTPGTDMQSMNSTIHSKFRIEIIHTPGRADGNFTKKLLILHIRKPSNILLF